MENNRTKGVIYYKLEDRYDGDITKYCGLSAGEIDSNMFFLRGYDIDDVKWDAEQRHLRFVRVNGDDIIVTGIDVPISMEKTYYDSANGVLNLNVNGDDYPIKGFGVYTGETIKGNGAINKPIEVTDTLRTGFFAPVESFIDLTDTSKRLPENPEYGVRYLTREKINSYGMLFNAKGMESVQEILKNDSSSWRVPTDEEWGEMLNALENEEDRNHDKKTSNEFNGKKAGAILKKGIYKWELTNISEKTDPEAIKFENNMLPNPSYVDYKNSIDGIYEIEKDVDGVKTYEHYKCVDVWKSSDEVTKYEDIEDEYGFNVPPAGYAESLNYTNKNSYGKWAGYWSCSETKNSDVLAREFRYDNDGVLRQAEGRNTFLSIRLVRDYNYEISSIEYINGLPYKTLLMPHVRKNDGRVEITQKVWMASNLSIPSLLPNQNTPTKDIVALSINDENGNEVPTSTVYFINFWNGVSWEKRLFNNNDMVVINNGPNGVFNEEWQLLNGELVNRADEVIDELKIYAETLIKDLDREHDTINDNQNKRIDEISEDIDDLEKRLTEETKNRENNDIKLPDNRELIINAVGGAILETNGGSKLNIIFNANFGEIDLSIENDCSCEGNDDCLFEDCSSYSDCACEDDFSDDPCPCEHEEDFECDFDNEYYYQQLSTLNNIIKISKDNDITLI